MTNSVIRTIISLEQATQQAGGSVFLFEELSKLTVMEFLKIIGSNYIVFKYDKPVE